MAAADPADLRVVCVACQWTGPQRACKAKQQLKEWCVTGCPRCGSIYARYPRA